MRAPFCLLLVVGVLLLLRWPASSLASVQVARTITVDQRGGGDYTTVQSALDAVPDGNSQWVKIYVKQGSYREKVIIPSEKGFILLEGDGSSSTDINFDSHVDGADAPGIAPITGRLRGNLAEISQTYNSSTFTVHSDNFVARNITFKNTYTGNNPAVAFLMDGDKGAFYDCAFHGYQDTLSDLAGRHYFRRCLVEGAVDFIFGYGRSIYQDCTLVSNMAASSQQPGWVTAHGRAADKSAAFVFKGGSITGSGRQYLGRAWNEQATVVFYQVNMASIVVPQGWAKWTSTQHVSQVTFAEVGCSGPGSATGGRVPWEKHMDNAEVQRFVDIGFIDDGWLSNQP
ncbi:probable pectinesterase 66 isoform X2 [Triticum urartu]|uniref:Pectinesterase n=2 Tax=Triticum urartu TaxID=4572 RepID=A0A8R7TE11_TRIUA|nr:probable pectinesterase 66 isoform X2 [Triticum urartu]XP_048554943.1 probable pectinesterase 66 isoform X2 [Triticum urartu]XP_048554945.1 probable pectinesterase 66 isoform X2 [Triticum urartu]